VTATDPSGPAASAGLHVGDVITSIDGASAASADQLAALTITKRPGDRVDLRYTRNGTQGSATIVLAARP
jgi:putative serine protease PepD